MNRATRALHGVAQAVPPAGLENPGAGQGALEGFAPGAQDAAALRAQHASLAAELEEARAAAERLRVAEADATRALLSAFDAWCAATSCPVHEMWVLEVDAFLRRAFLLSPRCGCWRWMLCGAADAWCS